MASIKAAEREQMQVKAFLYRVDGVPIYVIAQAMNLNHRTVSQLIAAETERISAQRAARRDHDLAFALYRMEAAIRRSRTQMDLDRNRLKETGPSAPGWQEKASLRHAISKWELEIRSTLTEINNLLGLQVKPAETAPAVVPSHQNNILLILNSLPPEEVIAMANEAAASGRGIDGFGKIETMARALTTAQESAREPLTIDQEPFE